MTSICFAANLRCAAPALAAKYAANAAFADAVRRQQELRRYQPSLNSKLGFAVSLRSSFCPRIAKGKPALPRKTALRDAPSFLTLPRFTASSHPDILIHFHNPRAAVTHNFHFHFHNPHHDFELSRWTVTVRAVPPGPFPGCSAAPMFQNEPKPSLSRFRVQCSREWRDLGRACQAAAGRTRGFCSCSSRLPLPLRRHWIEMGKRGRPRYFFVLLLVASQPVMAMQSLEQLIC